MKRRRWLRRLKRTAIALTVLCVAFIAFGWMLFQHIPRWYQPVVFAPEEMQAVRDNYGAVGSDISRRMFSDEGAFRYTFTQDQINAWLPVLRNDVPPIRELLPPAFQNPYVSIGPDGVRLAVTVNYDGIRTVMSALLGVVVDEEAISLRVKGVTGGSLPIPGPLLRQQLKRVDAKVGPLHSVEGRTVGPDDEVMPSTFLDGIQLTREYIWPNGERWYRILDLELQKGAIVATLEPLPGHHASR